MLFVAVGLFGYRLTDDRVLISFLPAFFVVLVLVTCLLLFVFYDFDVWC